MVLRSFPCPVCDAENWEPVHEYRYRRGEGEALGRPLSDYELLRRRILFEVWAPGQEELTLSSQLCGSCGFVCFAPRPSVEERSAGYRFLQQEEGDIGGSKSDPTARAMDRQRAERTLAAVERELGPVRGKRVLDFGGGDGKLLAPFVEAGAGCYLVDYNLRPLAGVEKLGDTLDDLEPGVDFDVIIASHVLEHLVDPRETVERLRGLLSPSGVLFMEVPDQVWKGVPIAHDAVTHVNFFHLPSLVRLLEEAGLYALTAVRTRSSYGAGKLDALVAVAGRQGRRSELTVDGAAEARRLLSPSFAMELKNAVRQGRIPRPRGMLRRLGLARGPVR